MAFDGTTIAAVRKELSDSILGGRIYKIAQPEPDELLITIKTPEGQRKLYISASASSQICWEWAYHSYLTAWSGTYFIL